MYFKSKLSLCHYQRIVESKKVKFAEPLLLTQTQIDSFSPCYNDEFIKCCNGDWVFIEMEALVQSEFFKTKQYDKLYMNKFEFKRFKVTKYGLKTVVGVYSLKVNFKSL